MRENTDQKNSKYGHFSYSVKITDEINMIYSMIQDFDLESQSA